VRRTRTSSSRCTVGYLETDVVRAVAAPKDPGDVARRVLDAIEAGDDEVLADATSRQVLRLMMTSAPSGRIEVASLASSLSRQPKPSEDSASAAPQSER